MSDDRALMRIHVEALFTHDPQGRLVRVNEPNGKEAPRFFLGRTAQGSEWRFRYDLEDDLVRELEAVCVSEPRGDEFLLPPHGATRYEELLARVAPIQRKEAGPAFHFPRELATPPGTVAITRENTDLLRPHLEAWLEDVALLRPMLAFVTGGRAVSVCCSVRITAVAHEAGVETVPEFRGRGYAAQAVTAWARAIRAMGPIPLYSTSWQNAASQAVARKLGLRRYGTTLHIT